MAVPADRFEEAVTSLVNENPHVEEAAILSTCNRMEVTIVGLSYDRAVAELENWMSNCLLYTSPSPRDRSLSRMPSSA